MFFGNPFGGDSNPFGDSIFGKSSSSLDIFGRKSTSVGSLIGVASTGKSPADEINKMDKLVKQLLELMKLEYGKMQFNNKEFDLVELENEIIRKSAVMVDKENVIMENNISGEIIVIADDFYIDQVLTNYITNAIKYAIEINGEKRVRIENEIDKKNNKVRIKVFNTFVQFSEEEINRIWKRFYKIDESRNRENGGNGIGLSLVKAIMNNYGNKYGVKNVAGGVEFYFELNLKK